MSKKIIGFGVTRCLVYNEPIASLNESIQRIENCNQKKCFGSSQRVGASPRKRIDVCVEMNDRNIEHT